jgi:hypothetical protein
MTPNLASARQAIQAELSHARQGMAFYIARVEALETALSQLESVDSDEAASRRNGKRKIAASNRRKAGEGKRERQADASSRSIDTEKLPTTGADFWLELVTDAPKSAVDIANAAASTLGLKPDQKNQIQKLKQRVAPALASLVSGQKVRSSGAGRERRFFRGERQSA